MPQYKKQALMTWFNRATKELDMIKRNSENKEFFYSYFLWQQAFEKIFKILISIYWADFEKTHDISELYNKVKNIYWSDITFLEWNSILFDKLNSMYFDERYWLDRITYNEDEILASIELLEKLVKFTKKKLESM